jgi:hypothetical protein
MPSLTTKDRAPLCLFSYEDGRRCRTPRTGRHPHFCFYHAQKEARAQAAEKLAKDLAYFFSGDYLSACDLSTALSRLIPAVIRGDIKPRLARTVAYMFQTQLQAIHLSEEEYINAFGTDGWRKAVRTSVNGNHDYLFPPDPNDDASDEAKPEPQQPQSPQPQRTQPQRQQPNAPSPQTPSRPQQSAPARPQPPSADRPSPANVEAALSVARELFPARPSSTPEQSAAPATNHATLTPQPSSSTNQPDTQTSQPENAMPPGPPRPQPRPATPNRDPYAVHFDHNYRLRVDGKLF